MVRTMLNENSLLKYFWTEAVNTTCNILNRVSIIAILKKTPYELWKGRKPNIAYFHVFGCKFYILNNKEAILRNLMLNLVKKYFLVIQQIAKHIEFSIEKS